MRSPSPNSVFTLVIAVAAAGTLGCADAPTQSTGGVDPPSLALTDASAASFTIALNDVRDRILPSLGPDEEAQVLASSLVELTAALAARSQSALDLAVDRVQSAVASLDQRGEAAELDAVRLVLENARQLAR